MPTVNIVGLHWTGHMSFLTGQDLTPKFARQVQPDRTESELIFPNILPAIKYFPRHKFGAKVTWRKGV